MQKVSSAFFVERTRAHPLEIQLAILSLAKEVERWDERHPAGTKDSGEAVGGRFMSKDEHLATKDNPIRQLKTAEAQQLANDLSFVETPEQLDEAITKRIAYLDPQEVEGGVDRSETTQVGLDFLEDNGLEVSEILDDPETGFTAFVVSGIDGKNTRLVFTGSNDATDWRLNAFNEVGRVQFEKNRDDIKRVLEDSFDKTGEKPKIEGHSLGGALSQITASEFPELISSVNTYNSASISSETVEKFIKAESRGIQPLVSLYYNDDDVVPYMKGDAIIPGEIHVYKRKVEQDLSWKAKKTAAHSDLLSDPRNELEEIDPQETDIVGMLPSAHHQNASSEPMRLAAKPLDVSVRVLRLGLELQRFKKEDWMKGGQRRGDGGRFSSISSDNIDTLKQSFLDYQDGLSIADVRRGLPDTLKKQAREAITEEVVKELDSVDKKEASRRLNEFLGDEDAISEEELNKLLEVVDESIVTPDTAKDKIIDKITEEVVKEDIKEDIKNTADSLVKELDSVDKKEASRKLNEFLGDGTVSEEDLDKLFSDLKSEVDRKTKDLSDEDIERGRKALKAILSENENDKSYAQTKIMDIAATLNEEIMEDPLARKSFEIGYNKVPRAFQIAADSTISPAIQAYEAYKRHTDAIDDLKTPDGINDVADTFGVIAGNSVEIGIHAATLLAPLPMKYIKGADMLKATAMLVANKTTTKSLAKAYKISSDHPEAKIAMGFFCGMVMAEEVRKLKEKNPEYAPYINNENLLQVQQTLEEIIRDNEDIKTLGDIEAIAIKKGVSPEVASMLITLGSSFI